jgi:hypothetical protein
MSPPQTEVGHTLFALQLFVPVDRALWRFDLIRLMRQSAAEIGPADKQRLWREAVARLDGALAEARFGVWDYVDDDERALEEYEQWCLGTVADAAEDSGVDRSDEDCYLFATLLLLCDAGGPADEQLREAVEAAEEDRWSKETFRLLLAAVAALDWRGVKSDTLFVRPGDTGWGVPADALEEEHYHYLQLLL